MLSQLPLELLSLIINHVDKKDLYNCTLTSKQFYEHANPLLWQSPNTRTGAALLKVISGIFVARQPLGQHVRCLEFCESLSDATFLLFLKHITQLEELHLSNGTGITDEGFKHFPQHCPNLKILYLHRTNITQQSYDLLGEHCKQLQDLTLSDMELSPNTFAPLTNCPLEILTIERYQLDDDDWMAIPYLTRLDHLTCLDFSYCSFEFLTLLLTTCDPAGDIPWPRLTDLTLHDCPAIDDRHYISFFKSHLGLKAVNFADGCVSEAMLNILPSLLPGIKQLRIEYSGPFTSQLIRHLIRKLPLLTTLSIGGCGVLSADFPEVDEYHLDDEYVGILNHTIIDRIQLGFESSKQGHCNYSGNDILGGGDQGLSGD